MASLFFTLELPKWYCHVAVSPKHVDKTVFVTEWWKYEYLVMPFGLRNTPATFQKLMDTVLQEVPQFARCYIDDVYMLSTDWDSHI